MGLQAAVSIEGLAGCPVSEAAAETGGRIDSVTKSAIGDRAIEEFELDAEAASPESADEVFDDGERAVYRFERDRTEPCFCECIEVFGCPVVDICAEGDEMRVTFRPTDVETLEEIIDALRETFGGINLEHLVRPGDREREDTVVVDRGRLTDRQREVIVTAYEMGYFEHPRGANAEEVASALGITSSTLRGHLSAAQSKLLESVLEG